MGNQGHGAESVTPLPPFRNDWTQSDIRGLSGLAGTLYSYIPPGEVVIKTLDRSVDKLVQDASWHGEAAQKFRSAWEKNANDAANFHSNIKSAAGIIDRLAVRLGWIQLWWEKQAAVLQRAKARGAHLKGNEGQLIAKRATAWVKEAQRKATEELNELNSGKLTPVMRAYLHDPEITDQKLVANEFSQVQGLLKDSENRLHPPAVKHPSEGLDDRILNSHTIKDMTGFGGAGGVVGTIGGAGVGVLGGPFAEITVPVGAGVGAVAGTVVGGVTGAAWGLGEDLDIW